jgi:hypothetical protein
MLLTAILLTGTFAARPSAATLPNGTLYASTDTGVIYQVQSAAWVSWLPAAGGGGGGTVTSVATGTGLSGGPITTTGTIAMANTAVTPGSYGDASNVGQFTVDAQGRITAAANVAISGAGGGLTLVENKIFTAAATTYDFSGLDGDADREYLLTGKIVAGSSGTPFFSIRLNAQATTYAIVRTQNASGSITGTTFTEPYIAGGPANAINSFEARIFAAKTVNSVAQLRQYLAKSIVNNAGAITMVDWAGNWTDTTNNITSIRLHCDTTNGIGNGSQVALYKLAQT